MGPVMALLVFNFVIFVIVVVVVVKHYRKRTRQAKDKSVKATIQTLLSIVGVAFTFGLTWLFGAFTVQNSRLPFLILFVVFSSFQGFFVFLFFCVLNREVRQAWVQFLTRGKGKKIVTVKPSKSSTPHGTLSTTLVDTNTSIPVSEIAHESSSVISNEHDMQEMQLEIYHTTEDEMYLNEGTRDTDISLTVRPESQMHEFTPSITCSAAEDHVVSEGHIISNPGADQDIDVSLAIHPTPPVHGDTNFSAAEGRVVSAHQDDP